MAVARFVVQGDAWAPETGEVVEAPVPVPCTVEELKRCLPLAGSFHFRQQVASPDPVEGYLWYDLTDDSVELELAGGRLEIRVLPLALEGADDGAGFDPDALDWAEGLDVDDGGADAATAGTAAAAWVSGLGDTIKENWAKLEAGKKIREASETVISSDAAVKLSNHGVKLGKGLGKIFRSGASAVQHLVHGDKPEPSLPSPAAKDALARLTTMLTTPFDDRNAEHVGMLRAIWDPVFPGQPFERQSNLWRTKLGFAHNDPLKDSKGSGVLAVMALHYFVDHRPDQCVGMINSQYPATADTYPVGVVAINLTLMLVSIVGVKQHRFRHTQAVFWDLFQSDGEAAFCELFIAAYLCLDYKWTSTQANRSQFPKLMVATKAWVEAMLDAAPKSIPQVQEHTARLRGR